MQFCFRCLKTLIKHKASVNDNTFEDGSTPLHFAALAGHVECVEILLENKVKYIQQFNYTCINNCLFDQQLNKKYWLLLDNYQEIVHKEKGSKLCIQSFTETSLLYIK